MVLGSVFVIERRRWRRRRLYLIQRRLRCSAAPNDDRYRRIYVYKFIDDIRPPGRLTKIQFLDSKRTNKCIHFRFYDADVWLLLLRQSSPFETVKMFQSQFSNVVTSRKLDIVMVFWVINISSTFWNNWKNWKIINRIFTQYQFF